ncbi:Uncharacterized protein BP5553_08754 [Venustampulla echinocandica]|uniref:Beta-lactamase-related domain-containing protein n=1 Tax=Venustampulla echinocandica TaxID=2656787 RepID=A0A370TF50_9HELO|nr:Uncharacterized protein BP5553_08754 [Venustampulla echinocandica]RDL33315.1 Uncharacterized protein BP5553_08754 [Venustampulla echinocandica]
MTFETYLHEATRRGSDRTLPGVVVIAADKNGITYTHASGTQSLDPTSPLFKKSFAVDTTMWIASCTKLLTAISILQCVEKGLLNLDTDLSDVLTEFKEIQILTGFEDEKPVYKKPETKITLRALLTHSSGFGYAAFDPKLMKEVEYRGGKIDMTGDLLEHILLPLLYEPNTSWSYGVGLDWAGLALERVTGQSLSAYMDANIINPLSMTSTSFKLLSRQDIMAARSDMSMRLPDGSLSPSPTRFFPDNAKDDYGGAGLFSCAQDYVKVLIDLLQDDSKLLSLASKEELFKQQLSTESKTALNFLLYGDYEGNKDGEVGAMFSGGLPTGTNVGYSLGGMLVDDTNGAGPNRRRKGALSWSGLPNLHWMVDREKGVALFYGSQLLPPGDVKTGEAFSKFEEAIYKGEL